jgi:hypothetical protein
MAVLVSAIHALVGEPKDTNAASARAGDLNVAPSNDPAAVSFAVWAQHVEAIKRSKIRPSIEVSSTAENLRWPNRSRSWGPLVDRTRKFGTTPRPTDSNSTR